MTQNELLSSFEKVLDEFGKHLGIDKFGNTLEVDSILEADEQGRKMWSDEELGHKAFTLRKYSIYLQRHINRNNAKVKWATSNLNVFYGTESKKYNAWSYEERKHLVGADNEAAKSLTRILLEADARSQELMMLSSKISDLANDLIELQKTKRAQHYESRNT